MSRSMSQWYRRVPASSRWGACPGLSGLSARRAIQGVMTKATVMDRSMATDAPTGMGRMYGPIRPPTKAMGMIAAITVNVASTSGARTSLTASTMTRVRFLAPVSGRARWRTMFSTSTIGSSTRMPIQKIRAKSVTRFNV